MLCTRLNTRYPFEYLVEHCLLNIDTLNIDPLNIDPLIIDPLNVDKLTHVLLSLLKLNQLGNESCESIDLLWAKGRSFAAAPL